jgi:DNA polymerase-3 subunit delta
VANLREQELEKDLERGKLRRLYFFHGPEYFKVLEWSQRLRKRLGADFEVERFYGDDFSSAHFLDSCRNLSLFGSNSLVHLSEADQLIAKDWDLILPALLDPPEGKLFLLTAQSLDARKKHAQALLKAPAEIGVVKAEFCDDRDFYAWGRELAGRRKKKISQTTLELLWRLVGPSLGELNQALEKSALYGGLDSNIEAEHVTAVVVRSRDEAIFAFTNSMAGGQAGQTLSDLVRLLEQGEEPIALLALLGKQYRSMLEILSGQENGEHSEDVLRSLGLPPRFAKLLDQQARRLGWNRVAKGLNSIRATDLVLKSSAEPPRLALERLALDLLAN